MKGAYDSSSGTLFRKFSSTVDKFNFWINCSFILLFKSWNFLNVSVNNESFKVFTKVFISLSVLSTNSLSTALTFVIFAFSISPLKADDTFLTVSSRLVLLNFSINLSNAFKIFFFSISSFISLGILKSVSLTNDLRFVIYSWFISSNKKFGTTSINSLKAFAVSFILWVASSIISFIFVLAVLSPIISLRLFNISMKREIIWVKDVSNTSAILPYNLDLFWSRKIEPSSLITPEALNICSWALLKLLINPSTTLSISSFPISSSTTFVKFNKILSSIDVKLFSNDESLLFNNELNRLSNLLLSYFIFSNDLFFIVCKASPSSLFLINSFNSSKSWTIWEFNLFEALTKLFAIISINLELFWPKKIAPSSLITPEALNNFWWVLLKLSINSSTTPNISSLPLFPSIIFVKFNNTSSSTDLKLSNGALSTLFNKKLGIIWSRFSNSLLSVFILSATFPTIFLKIVPSSLLSINAFNPSKSRTIRDFNLSEALFKLLTILSTIFVLSFVTKKVVRSSRISERLNTFKYLGASLILSPTDSIKELSAPFTSSKFIESIIFLRFCGFSCLKKFTPFFNLSALSLINFSKAISWAFNLS